MATKRLVWCFLFFVFATVSVHSKFARGKPRERSKSSHREGVRGSGSGYGERLPWEGRQETYDWAFKEVSLDTFISILVIVTLDCSKTQWEANLTSAFITMARLSQEKYLQTPFHTGEAVESKTLDTGCDTT